MYIEMVDETGQVSQNHQKQTQEILEFAAQKTGENKGNGCERWLTNEQPWAQRVPANLTDMDVINLGIQPEWILPLLRKIYSESEAG